MTIGEANEYVNTEIAAIERGNIDKELRPWEQDACKDASRHWGLVQQRIALSRPNPQRLACCDSLHLTAKERTPAQILAAEANGRRLAATRAA
jgi:hypothetical protein